jgi:hypothetical protein
MRRGVRVDEVPAAANGKGGRSKGAWIAASLRPSAPDHRCIGSDMPAPAVAAAAALLSAAQWMGMDRNEARAHEHNSVMARLLAAVLCGSLQCPSGLLAGGRGRGAEGPVVRKRQHESCSRA